MVIVSIECVRLTIGRYFTHRQRTGTIGKFQPFGAAGFHHYIGVSVCKRKQAQQKEYRYKSNHCSQYHLHNLTLLQKKAESLITLAPIVLHYMQNRTHTSQSQRDTIFLNNKTFYSEIHYDNAPLANDYTCLLLCEFFKKKL